MAAEALLVTEPRDADDHRVGILPVREEAERRRLAADLVLGIVDIGEELDLRHRQETVVRHADGEAQYGLFVQQGVDDAGRAEALVELGGNVVDAALRPDILARDDDLRVRRSEEHTSELQSLMRISYAVFCLKKKKA